MSHPSQFDVASLGFEQQPMIAAQTGEEETTLLSFGSGLLSSHEEEMEENFDVNHVDPMVDAFVSDDLQGSSTLVDRPATIVASTSGSHATSASAAAAKTVSPSPPTMDSSTTLAQVLDVASAISKEEKDSTSSTTNAPAYRGYSYHKRFNKWVAYFPYGHKQHQFGNFSTKDQASCAAKAAQEFLRQRNQDEASSTSKEEMKSVVEQCKSYAVDAVKDMEQGEATGSSNKMDEESSFNKDHHEDSPFKTKARRITLDNDDASRNAVKELDNVATPPPTEKKQNNLGSIRYDKQRSKWEIRVQSHQKRHYIGLFATQSQARLAQVAAHEKLKEITTGGGAITTSEISEAKRAACESVNKSATSPEATTQVIANHSPNTKASLKNDKANARNPFEKVPNEGRNKSKHVPLQHADKGGSVKEKNKGSKKNKPGRVSAGLGYSWDRDRQKCQTYFRYNGKMYQIHNFLSEEQAASASEAARAVLYERPPARKGTREEQDIVRSARIAAMEAATRVMDEAGSVKVDENDRKWEVHVALHGKQLYVGRFETKFQATRALFAARAKLLERTSLDENAQISQEDLVEAAKMAASETIQDKGRQRTAVGHRKSVASAGRKRATRETQENPNKRPRRAASLPVAKEANSSVRRTKSVSIGRKTSSQAKANMEGVGGTAGRKKTPAVKISRGLGYSWDKNRQKCQTYFRYNGKMYQIHNFLSEEQAASASEAARAVLHERPPAGQGTREEQDIVFAARKSAMEAATRVMDEAGSMEMDEEGSKWEVHVKFQEEQHFIGHFETKLQATRALFAARAKLLELSSDGKTDGSQEDLDAAKHAAIEAIKDAGSAVGNRRPDVRAGEKRSTVETEDRYPSAMSTKRPRVQKKALSEGNKKTEGGRKSLALKKADNGSGVKRGMPALANRVSTGRGYSWDKKRQWCQSYFRYNGRMYMIGKFVAEEQAASASKAARTLLCQQHPVGKGTLEEQNIVLAARTGALEAANKVTNEAGSVEVDKESETWGVHVTVQGKPRYVGQFDSKTHATRALFAARAKLDEASRNGAVTSSTGDLEVARNAIMKASRDGQHTSQKKNGRNGAPADTEDRSQSKDSSKRSSKALARKSSHTVENEFDADLVSLNLEVGESRKQIDETIDSPSRALDRFTEKQRVFLDRGNTEENSLSEDLPSEFPLSQQDFCNNPRSAYPPYFSRFVSIVAIGCAGSMVAGQILGMTYFPVPVMSLMVRAYLVFFSAVVVLNEIEWTQILRDSAVFQNLIFRGMLYSFVGLVGSMMNDVVYEGKHDGQMILGFSFCLPSQQQALLTYNGVVSFTIFITGVTYLAMGLVSCMQRSGSRNGGKLQRKVW